MVRVDCEWPIGDCKIALVGEAPGTDEELLGRPFVGRSGKILNKMLHYAGIKRKECLVTNVFDYVLDRNSVHSIGVPKKHAPKETFWPQLKVPVEKGCYITEEVGIPSLVRLHLELAEFNPNVVVALGGTAVWALLAIAPFGKMKKMVGTVHKAACQDWKVIPTYHPAYIGRNYADLPGVVANLKKVKRESEFPEIRRPAIEIIIPEHAHQVCRFLRDIGKVAAVDIETQTGAIDNIGFADCFERAMSVPIYRPDTYQGYWHSPEQLKLVMWAIARYLQDPAYTKVMQNGSYDVQWIWEKWHIPVYGWTEDTRLLHHALWPESPKDLGTIAALHLDMPAWKLSGAGRASTKREE